MSFTEFITTQKPELQKALLSFLDEKQSSSPLPEEALAIEKISQLSQAGKMWRGLFVLLTHSLLTDTDQVKTEGVMKAAIAMELVQTALLTHDDIIDNDFTRRGQPTIFAQYIPSNGDMSSASTNIIEFGKSMGIGVGDIAIFLAYEALAEASSDAIMLSTILKTFSRELQLVGTGEMLDIRMAAATIDPTLPEITDMYRYKTARYTFSLPLMLGAQLGGAPAEIISALDMFGENAGVLFQIRDDGLGLTGDESITGKPVGADIKENKKTIHRALLFQHCNPAELGSLHKAFGNKNLSESERDSVLELLSKHEIENKVQELAQEYTTKALDALEKLPSSLQNNLKEVLTAVSTRTK